MPARKLPPNDQLLKWLGEGKTHGQIVDLVFRTTGQVVGESAVSAAVSRLGVADRRQNHLDYIPWRVQAQHIRQYPAVMLRAYARYMKAGQDPDALTPNDWRRLKSWLAERRATKTVVDYKPDEGGFTYVRARGSEDVVRQPPRRSPLRRTGTTG